LVEEQSGACGMCGGEVKCIHGFGGEIRRKKTTWKALA